jgi:hypothetical protein
MLLKKRKMWELGCLSIKTLKVYTKIFESDTELSNKRQKRKAVIRYKLNKKVYCKNECISLVHRNDNIF